MPPTNPPPPMPPPKHPPYFPVHVLETAKLTEIRDAMGTLRYRVVMSTYDIDNHLENVFPAKAYMIQVVNDFYDKEAPLVIVTVPDEGEPPLLDYSIALETYESYVKNYTSLVKAETKEMQDMDIYAEKVGYHHTCPPCCATCKWCHEHKCPRSNFPLPPPMPEPFKKKLECQCPKNVNEFNFDVDRQDEPCHHDIYPHYHHPQPRPMPILFPHVKPLGLCDNYEKLEATPTAAGFDRF